MPSSFNRGLTLAVLSLLPALAIPAASPQLPDTGGNAGSEAGQWRCRDKYFGRPDRNCGAGALGDLLRNDFGEDLSNPDVFSDLWNHSDADSHQLGFSLLDIKQYLLRHGYQGDGYSINLDQLTQFETSALAIVDTAGSAHFVVVRAVGPDDVLISDPAFGLVKISRARFQSIWTNGILFVIRHKDKLPLPNRAAESVWAKAAPESDYLLAPPTSPAPTPPPRVAETPAPGPSAEPAAPPREPTLTEKLAEKGVNLKFTGRVQSFVADSDYATQQPFNAQNRFAKLPTTELNTEFRPLLSLSYDRLDLLVKPRLRLQWDEIRYGARSALTQDEFQASVYLLEGWARLGLTDRLFASFGREVMLWGPSMYITPSNPFFLSNNRSNPYRELRGRDYAKANYLINDQWTVSFISNVGRGLDVLPDQDRFRRTDAIKLDFTGMEINSSLIASRRDDGQERLGGYLQWTASEALLLYLDGHVNFGSDTLYPTRLAGPAGWTFSRPSRHEIQGVGLIGGQYTFDIGPTLSLEYVHNSAGYDDREAADYFRMANDLSAIARAGIAASAPAGGLLARAQAPGTTLLRKNYFFAQLMQTGVFDDLDLTLRYTQNLDDGGIELAPILDWSVGNSTHLFALSAINLGGRRSEARRYLENQVFIGVNYTFSN